MANSDNPPDAPPSISAAELRRRLLASTPPPMAAGASGSIRLEDLQGSESAEVQSTQDKLRKLKMPGPPLGSGSIPQPGARRSTVVGVKQGDSGTVSGSGTQRMPHRSMSTDDSPGEVARLKSENRELRQLLEEMKNLLQEASDTEQQYATRETDFLAVIAEKQRHLDELTSQFESIEEQIASGKLGPQQIKTAPKAKTELETWNDDLEKENAAIEQQRRKLEDERQQLRDDEESLERQMRDMEVSMARDRALMARQETELKRLNAEIQHELEMIQRGDGALRDQMAKFQRRAQDVMQKPR